MHHMQQDATQRYRYFLLFFLLSLQTNTITVQYSWRNFDSTNNKKKYVIISRQ